VLYSYTKSKVNVAPFLGERHAVVAYEYQNQVSCSHTVLKMNSEKFSKILLNQLTTTWYYHPRMEKCKQQTPMTA